MVNLAVRENMVPGATLEDRLAVLERLGYDGIELTAAETLARDPDVLAPVFQRGKVKAATVEGVRRLLDPDPAERATSMALLRKRLDLAGRIGGVGVLLVPIFGPPLIPDLSPWRSAVELERELLLAQLRELAGDAEKAGSAIILEPLNRYETHFLRTLDQAAELCRRINRPTVRILADFFHMNLEEPDIAASLRRSAPFVRHVHVADSNRWQPGRGHLDLRPGFQALKDHGYDGFVSVECTLIGAPEDALTEAADFTRKAWEEA
jgi:sugar phosphate isomerase/epimerase